MNEIITANQLKQLIKNQPPKPIKIGKPTPSPSIDEIEYKIGVSISDKLQYITEDVYNTFIDSIPDYEEHPKKFFSELMQNALHTEKIDSGRRVIDQLRHLWVNYPELGIEYILKPTNGPQEIVYIKCNKKVNIKFENTKPVLPFFQ